MVDFRNSKSDNGASIRPESDDISIFFVYKGDLYLYIADTGQKFKISDNTFGNLISGELSVGKISEIIDRMNFQFNLKSTSTKSGFDFALSPSPILVNASFAIIIYYDSTKSYLKALEAYQQLKNNVKTRIIHVGPLAAFGRFGIQTNPEKEETVKLPYGYNIIECELGYGVTEVKGKRKGGEYYPIKIEDILKGCAFYVRHQHFLRDDVLLLNSILHDFKITVVDKKGNLKDQVQYEGDTTIPTIKTINLIIKESDIIEIEINGECLSKITNRNGIIESFEVGANGITNFTIQYGGWKFIKSLDELIHEK